MAKTVVDIETLEASMKVSEWERLATACKIASNALRAAGAPMRAVQYTALADKCEHRATELMHGRVIP